MRFRTSLAVAATLVAAPSGLASPAHAQEETNFHAMGVAVIEGDAGLSTMTFTVTREGGDLSRGSGVRVAIRDITASFRDYQSVNAVYVSFAPGETTGQGTLQIKGDTVNEGDETILLWPRAGSTTGGDDDWTSAVGTIIDDDTTPGDNTLAIGDVTAPEGNTGTTDRILTVTRTGDRSSTAQVKYRTVAGSASAPSDYQETTGTLTFPVGGSSAQITVPVVGDYLVEPDETFTVELYDVSGFGTAIIDDTGLVTLANDDVDPSFYTINDASVAEGDTGTTTATFTITRSGNTAIATTVHPWTQDITATRNLDYVNVPSTNSMTFAPGETLKSFSVTVNGDDLDEADETFRVRLAGGTVENGQADTGAGTILDDDIAGPNSLAISDSSAAEGQRGTSTRTLTVTRSGDTSGPAQVRWRTVDRTAKAPTDYTAAGGERTFAPGQATASLSVTTIGDTDVERDETFDVQLFGATGTGTTIADNKGVVTLVDDDGDTLSTYTIGDATVAERDGTSSTLTFAITRSGNTAVAATVRPWTQDITATHGVDYVNIPSTNTLRFGPGQTTKTLRVTVMGDDLTEGDETLRVRFAGGTTTPGQGDTGIGTIVDDD